MAITPTLATRRTMALRRLPDTCTIQQVTESHTTEGTTQTFTTRASGVACRFSTLSGRDIERAGQFAAEADCKVTLPGDVVVQTNDRIVVTKAQTNTVHTVDVEHVNKRSEEVTRGVLCKDISTSAT